ncbi:Uncharacterised protein [Candidatus Bilamarchaeum dharawalense]|uniref:Uncharacterized protein n=1 Tax=Candidatus Bilamarchaeum dharawalense TaxID=2885759 RepID=A0A5E4LQM5_9ARCH|nr:Uncharacterised protein [Candidatus Bilamarchaeum dharawalense]
MVALDIIDEENKAKIVTMWKNMSETDKAHFINQVALALSIWGSDEKGKKLVVEVLRFLSNNGTSTLADFGLYIEKVCEVKDAAGLTDKIRRAAKIIESYRIKNALSSEPHRDLDI